MAQHAESGTLTANQVTTVTLTSRSDYVQVISRDDTFDIWFTVDGSTPGVAATDSYYVGPRGAESVRPPLGDEQPTVNLISTGAAQFTVQVI